MEEEKRLTYQEALWHFLIRCSMQPRQHRGNLVPTTSRVTVSRPPNERKLRDICFWDEMRSFCTSPLLMMASYRSVPFTGVGSFSEADCYFFHPGKVGATMTFLILVEVMFCLHCITFFTYKMKLIKAIQPFWRQYPSHEKTFRLKVSDTQRQYLISHPRTL